MAKAVDDADIFAQTDPVFWLDTLHDRSPAALAAWAERARVYYQEEPAEGLLPASDYGALLNVLDDVLARPSHPPANTALMDDIKCARTLARESHLYAPAGQRLAECILVCLQEGGGHTSEQ